MSGMAAGAETECDSLVDAYCSYWDPDGVGGGMLSARRDGNHA